MKSQHGENANRNYTLAHRNYMLVIASYHCKPEKHFQPRLAVGGKGHSMFSVESRMLHSKYELGSHKHRAKSLQFFSNRCQTTIASCALLISVELVIMLSCPCKGGIQKPAEHVSRNFCAATGLIRPATYHYCFIFFRNNFFRNNVPNETVTRP